MLLKKLKPTVTFEVTDSNYCFQIYDHSELDCELFHIRSYSALTDWLKNTYDTSQWTRLWARSWSSNIEQESLCPQDASILVKDANTLIQMGEASETEKHRRGCIWE